MKSLILVGFSVSIVMQVTWTVSAQQEPPCQNKICGESEVCREVETCVSGACSVRAECLSAENSRRSGEYGCRFGRPLLKKTASGVGYDLRSCYNENDCQAGFYCSTELQDVSSRCCRASPAVTKPGSCPRPSSTDFFFCANQCRSDADCFWGLKCCQKSLTCTKKTCQLPEPCSLKTCPSGTGCVVAPDYTAHCLTRIVIPEPPAPMQSV